MNHRLKGRTNSATSKQPFIGARHWCKAASQATNEPEIRKETIATTFCRWEHPEQPAQHSARPSPFEFILFYLLTTNVQHQRPAQTDDNPPRVAEAARVCNVTFCLSQDTPPN